MEDYLPQLRCLGQAFAGSRVPNFGVTEPGASLQQVQMPLSAIAPENKAEESRETQQSPSKRRYDVFCSLISFYVCAMLNGKLKVFVVLARMSCKIQT